MKRILWVLLMVCSSHTWGQDFASKFMEQYSGKEIQCQTVSPLMMEKLIDVMPLTNSEGNENVQEYLFSKLKSARIVTVTRNCENFFNKAENLIEKNKNRFSPLMERPTDKNNKIFVRKHNEMIRELVMLSLDTEDRTFTIVNLTGDMNDRFIQLLSSIKYKQE
ncbi:DUF4252 domain-containing protein [Bacteroides acidifaciens]|uniref:DUF4252 domain-containing protein n=1 Tax=Bacteroides acidifaciens TaxID=85831 RepID=UPI00301376AC